MITIDDKLYITKSINIILVNYANEVVLKELLLEFSFENLNNKNGITNLLQVLNYSNGDKPPIEQQDEILNFLILFLEKISKEKTKALYFWLINKRYLNYLEETDVIEEKDSDENFGYNFGRELAYKLYEPETSGLEEELYEELQNLLIRFASEFSLSIMDSYAIQDVKDMIEIYTGLKEIKGFVY